MIGDGSHSYIYDAENRVIQVGGTSGQCSTATACYVYNASRQRVTKTTSAGTVYYVYDIAGHQVAEFSSSGAWNRGEVYAGSKHLATYVGGTNGSTYLDLADWVGTERMRVNSTQSPQETCTGLPFGDMQSCTGTDESPMHYTGQQWDSEDNLTAFWFRTDSTTQGRWGSMDPAGLAAVDPTNPQTWNRYAYVTNNPISFIDPLGLYIANPCYNDPTCGGDGGPGGDPCLNCGSGPLLPVTPPGGTGGGGGSGGKQPTCGVVPLRRCAANNGTCGITVKCRGIQTDNLGKIGMQHCDAQVTTSSGQLWSLSGGPQPNYMSITALNAWATSPPTEPFTGTTVYQGNSCTAAGCMVQATQAWNQDIVKPEYRPVSGPNSNTWLKGTAAGCGVSLPINTWGSIW